MSIASTSFTRHPGRVIMAMLAKILATHYISAARAENPADGAERVYTKLPVVVTADQADQCAQTLALSQQAQEDGGLAATFSLLNWNVEKAKDPSLVSEFAALGRLSDLIFLQEAVPLKKSRRLLSNYFSRRLCAGTCKRRSRQASSPCPKLPISSTASYWRQNPG